LGIPREVVLVFLNAVPSVNGNFRKFKPEFFMESAIGFSLVRTFVIVFLIPM